MHTVSLFCTVWAQCTDRHRALNFSQNAIFRQMNDSVLFDRLMLWWNESDILSLFWTTKSWINCTKGYFFLKFLTYLPSASTGSLTNCEQAAHQGWARRNATPPNWKTLSIFFTREILRRIWHCIRLHAKKPKLSRTSGSTGNLANDGRLCFLCTVHRQTLKPTIPIVFRRILRISLTKYMSDSGESRHKLLESSIPLQRERRHRSRSWPS